MNSFIHCSNATAHSAWILMFSKLIATIFSISMNSQELENLCTSWCVKRTTKMWLTIESNYESKLSWNCITNVRSFTYKLSPLHSYLLCLKSLCIIKSTLLTSCMFRLIIVAFNSRILIFITNGKINNSFTFNFWIINNKLFRANDNEAAAHNSREFTYSTEHSHTEYL